MEKQNVLFLSFLLVIATAGAVLYVKPFPLKTNRPTPTNEVTVVPTTLIPTPTAFSLLLTAMDFKAKISATPDAVIIDIRTAEEFSTGHLASAQNIDFYKSSDFRTYLESQDKSAPYFVYCASGKRSKSAMEVFKELAFTNVSELEGGITAWKEAKFNVVK